MRHDDAVDSLQGNAGPSVPESPTPQSVAVVRLPQAGTGLPERSLRLAVGAGSRAIALLDQVTGGSGRVPAVVDAAVGAVAVGGEALSRAGAVVGGLLSPAARVAAYPPLVPPQWAPGTLVGSLIDRGRAERTVSVQQLESAWSNALPAVVPGVVDEVLDQMDLTDVVLSHVDLERIVVAALDSMDLTETVVTRVDLGRVVGAALDELDLTNLVLQRVDLAKVVDSALQSLDLTDVVLTEVDLVRVAEYVIDAIDLPAIIRESSGGIATEAVRGVRMQSIDADERVQNFVDKIIRRRHERDSAAIEIPNGDDG